MEVCEDCGGLLVATSHGLECSECGRTYPADDVTEDNGDSEP
jgi:hypothetical protein